MSEPAWVPIGGALPVTYSAMELIDKIDLGAKQDFSAIPQDYDSLRLVIKARSPQAVAVSNCYLRFNGDAGPNYDYGLLYLISSAVQQASAAAQAEALIGTLPGASATTALLGTIECLIPDYNRSGQGAKSFVGHYHSASARSAAGQVVGVFSGLRYNGDPITQIILLPHGGGLFVAGSLAWLYGLRGTKTTPVIPPSPIVGMGTTLPASPVDGDEFILTDSLTAPTYSWRLRYIAAKATNKWMFIGGAPAVVEVATAQGTNSGSYVDLATDGPSFVLPVAGSYDVRGEANLQTSLVDALISVGIHINAVEALYIPTLVALGGQPLVRGVGAVSVAGSAGHVVKLRYKTSGSATGTYSFRRLEVRPRAVGG